MNKEQQIEEMEDIMNCSVIDFIEDKCLNFHRGNAVKYIARAGKKNPEKEIEDLKKAAWYINREIERLENEQCDEILKYFKEEKTDDKARTD